ncbi:FKBP-type peptidyl-prolyl cis-trans isomerase [Microbacterium sediminis]|uniref:FKBP-type peptidyl-prolyl cis-trans isomerase n=1 Tax=Microbacterium sediminis TaxID=904291 RepID=UPI0009FEE9F3|nr:FKBP-type peptidyl-prolyl cis-trans isomerase [Microbacterium sediminis]
MRRRSAALLSTMTLAVLALAGCATSGDSTAEPEPTGTPADLCAAAADSGPAVEALTVSDAPLSDGVVEVTFEAPLTVDQFQRQVVVEGDGAPLEAGQFVDVAITGYDATTGELVGTAGYNPGEQLPQQISPESTLGIVLGCAPIGSRVAAAYVGGTAEDGTEVPPAVYTFDVLGVTPTAAWGEQQEPVEGMPTVELADDGAPTVTIPEGLETPDTTQLATLKTGDGITVEDGDQVMVQYTGIRASNGEEFDSSWASGPIDFNTSGVIEGFTKALVGQTVGSQVLAVIPPAEGYGEGEINENDLTGETLIFVVDILATQHLAAG